MIVNRFNLNDVFFELDVKLLKKGFNDPDVIIKRNLLNFAHDNLKKFGLYNKELKLTSYLKSKNDCTIICTYLIKK